MFKLGDLVKIVSLENFIFEVINVKNSGLLYDLKRSFDAMVLKNVPLEFIMAE